MNELLNLFTSSETPFLLLFVILFWFYIREAKTREERLAKEIESKIEEIKADQKIMITIWKILIENEMERRNKNGS